MDPLVRGDYQRAAIEAVSEIDRRLQQRYAEMSTSGMDMRPVADALARAHHAAMSELLTIAGGNKDDNEWRSGADNVAVFDAKLRELRIVAADVVRRAFVAPPSFA